MELRTDKIRVSKELKQELDELFESCELSSEKIAIVAKIINSETKPFAKGSILSRKSRFQVAELLMYGYQTPDEELREWVDKLRIRTEEYSLLKMEAVMKTLEILGISVEGVNCIDF